jgi:hypothetical protein
MDSKTNNAVVDYLKAHGTPVTRENYLNLAYLGDPPKELSAEEEAAIPEELRKSAESV